MTDNLELQGSMLNKIAFLAGIAARGGGSDPHPLRNASSIKKKLRSEKF